MVHDIVLRKTNNRYIAKSQKWPEVYVEENSRSEALQQIKTRLFDYLSNQVEIVQVEVPLPTNTGNPWIDTLGWFKDDPTFDDLQDEIAAYREELDKEQLLV